MSELEIMVLEKSGWVVESRSPLKISNQVTGYSAAEKVAHLVVRNVLDQEAIKWVEKQVELWNIEKSDIPVHSALLMTVE